MAQCSRHARSPPTSCYGLQLCSCPHEPSRLPDQSRAGSTGPHTAAVRDGLHHAKLYAQSVAGVPHRIVVIVAGIKCHNLKCVVIINGCQKLPDTCPAHRQVRHGGNSHNHCRHCCCAGVPHNLAAVYSRLVACTQDPYKRFSCAWHAGGHGSTICTCDCRRRPSHLASSAAVAGCQRAEAPTACNARGGCGASEREPL